MVAKGLVLASCGRPEIQPTTAYLSTQIPTIINWDRLVHLMSNLSGICDFIPTMLADNLNVVKWLVDLSFAVHHDFKSHTAMTMSMEAGTINTMSRKQNLNTQSSNHAKLIGADNAATMILWTSNFMECQGYPIKDNILLQDKKSAILLETNGAQSSGKRSHALNVCYFSWQINLPNNICMWPTDLPTK